MSQSYSRFFNFTRAGFLGAAALGAAFLLPGSDARAQATLSLAKTVYAGQDGGAGCPGGSEVVRGNSGELITFCFQVQNTGSEVIVGVTVTDAQLGFSSVIGNLNPGQSATRFFDAAILSDSTNTATVVGTAVVSGQVQDTDTARVDALADCPTRCYLVGDNGNNGGPDRLYLFDFGTVPPTSTDLGDIQPNPAVSLDANCLEALAFEPPQFGVEFPRLFSIDAGDNCGNGPIGTTNQANQGFLGVISYSNANGVVAEWMPLPNAIGLGRGSYGLIPINDVDAMSFDASPAGGNILYAAVRQDNNPIRPGDEQDLLVQIDHNTGMLIPDAFGPGIDYVPFEVVTNNLNQVLADIDGMAIDPLSGQLWAIANAGGTRDELVSFDKFTGRIILNQGIPQRFPLLSTNGVTRFQDMEALNFGPDGELYASSGADSPDIPLRNSIFTIERVGANAGRTTQIGNAPVAGIGDYEGSDCFFIQPSAFSTISGKVFWDLNENGLQEPTEAPLQDALVTLWSDVDNNQVLDIAVDFQIDAFFTGADGLYTFITPIDQRYIVAIDNAGLPPDFCSFTTPTESPMFVPNFCGVNEIAPDFGITSCRELGDFVWDDRDQDGIQDPGEPGISNVVVRLYSSAGVLLTNTVSDAVGAYLFTDLASAEYRVEFVAPANYLFSPAKVTGDDTNDSDPDPTTGLTALVSTRVPPPPGFLVTRITTADAGLFLLGDVAISKAAQPLLPSAGNVVFNYQVIVTNLGLRVENGLQVSDVLPAGLEFQSSNAGSFNPATRTWSATIAALPAGASSTFTILVSVTNNFAGVITNTACVANALPETNLANNCGNMVSAAIGNFVWNDVNADGIQDPGESGIDGAVVTLVDAVGTTVGSTVTTNGGAYAFAGVTPGTYVVSSPIPSGPTTRRSPANAAGDATLDSDGDAVTGQSGAVALLAGQTDDTLDFGFFAPFLVVTANPLCLNDTPYLDYTVQVVGASTNGGVTISFLPVGSTQVVASTSGLPLSGRILYPGAAVDGNGDPTDWPGWRFDGVNWVSENDGLRPTVQMNFNVNPELTVVVPYPAATPICVPEPVISVGNRVFLDRDGSGSFDGADAGISGVTVELFTTGPDQVIGGGDDAPVDADAFTAGVQSTTVTDANGFYLFSRVPSARYYVVIPSSQFQVGGPLDGLVSSVGFGTDGVSDENVDENGQDNVNPAFNGVVSVALTVAAANAPVSDIDAGPLSGQADNSENLTLDFAFFVQPRVGDFVWNDLNRNGIQDPGEPGVDNVQVELLDNLGALVASTVTTNGGFYGFTVNPGQYQIRFTPAPGTEFVPANAGGTAGTDSNANPATGTTPLFTLLAEQVDLTVDAGLQDLLSGVVIEKTVAVGAGQACPGTELVTVLSGMDVTYCFVVTNTGQTHLVSVLLTDTNITPNVLFDFDFLAPGESRTTSVSVVANTDLLNTARVEGTPSTPNRVPLVGRPPVSRVDTAAVNVIGPSIDIRKSVYAGNNGVLGCEGVDFIAVTNGQAVTYCFVVTNTGDSILDDVTITDTNLVPSVSLSVGSLAAGQSITQAVSTVATVDLVNTADASGQPPAGPRVRDLDPAEVDVVNPGISILKSVYLGHNSGASCQGVEEVAGTNNTPVTYCFLIRNTGDAPLADVTVTDSSVNPPLSRNIGGLLPGGSATAFIERFITADLVNTAFVTGNPPAGPPVTSNDVARVRFIPVGSIGNFVWDDTNANGVQDPGEPGLPGVAVRLLNSTNLSVLASTTTGPLGAYLFADRVPGSYVVEITPPVGSIPTPQDVGVDTADSDIDASARTAAFLMPGNVNDDTRDAGVYFPAAITGQVRNDNDGDGDLADPDPALPGAVVELFRDSDCDGNADVGTPAVASQQTGANGLYSFTNLVPGCYVVRETNPAGFTSTGDRTPPNDDRIPLTVTSGQTSTGNDFLDMLPGRIGNFVWDDLNGNGVQDPGEPGIPNVTVTLINAANSVVATSTSDGNGLYSFSNVVPGTYQVAYDPATLPAGFVQTIAAPGSPTLNSDPDPITRRTPAFLVVSGTDNQDLDIGAYGTVSVGDRVWLDANDDGIQNPGEANVPGITVTLFSNGPALPGSPVQVGAPQITDSNGAYRFTGLAPGRYFVQFDLATIPAGHVVSTPNQGGDDTLDSDANVVDGLTPPTVLLISGSSDLTLDMGLVPLKSIGDTVWYDVNGNGVADEVLGNTVQGTETRRGLGIPNVTVELYQVVGLVSNLVGTTVTQSNVTNNGFYEFTNRRPGQYVVQVVRSSVPAYFTRSTTPLFYALNLVTSPSVDNADFGFGTPSTAVELISFTAEPDLGSVRLAWSTGSETENFGFNLYRSDRSDGVKTLVNPYMVEAGGSAAGGDYLYVDASVTAGIWYYWLEDVEYSGQSTLHGPVRVVLKPLENRVFEISEGGLFLLEAGTDAESYTVQVDGKDVPSLLGEEGTLTFYAPAGAVSAQVVRSATPVRMAARDAAPQGGDTVVVVSDDGLQVSLSTVADASSYLAIGFAGDDLVVVDVTDPADPLVLTGVEVLQTSSDSGAYFSSATESSVRLLVQRTSAIRRLR